MDLLTYLLSYIVGLHMANSAVLVILPYVYNYISAKE